MVVFLLCNIFQNLLGTVGTPKIRTNKIGKMDMRRLNQSPNVMLRFDQKILPLSLSLCSLCPEPSKYSTMAFFAPGNRSSSFLFMYSSNSTTPPCDTFGKR